MSRNAVLPLLLAAVVSSCAGSPPQAAPAPGADPASLRAAALADSVRHSVTPADVRFMEGMIGHHAQAIVMAKWAPSHGASPVIQVLTARIINAQRDEIATMQRWLRDNGQAVPEPDTVNAHMGMHGMHMMMPGMLSDAQMDQLDAARGPEFDQLFLLFMIQHHQGALAMVDDLFKADGGAQNDLIYKFATDVFADQGTEIDRMQKLLLTLSTSRGS